MVAAVALLALLAQQQYPPELPPIRPAIPVPMMGLLVPIPAQDLAAAPPGEPIRQLMLCPSNVFTAQTDCNTYASQAQTAANAVYAADPSNLTRVVTIGVFLPTYPSINNMSQELQQMQQNHLGAVQTCVNLICTWGPPLVDVFALRTQYAADRVTLLDNDGSACGLGYMSAALYGAAWAFSVVNKGCGIGNSSLWHEWGHNDGLCHDIPNAASCTPAQPYGYGYCDPNGNHQSPMTYPSPCGKPRTIFSNKDNTWTYGYPYGDATHDEAAVQRWSMPIEANFLPPPPTHRPSSVTQLTAIQ